MKLFSKKQNLFNDQAAKRHRNRELVGGAIVIVVIYAMAYFGFMMMVKP